MSEKQLTVAELMARAAAEGRDDTSRRRRRRSLEDGGVSVAELSGNLPKVDAKPNEPRHTSEPIDPPEEAPKPAPAAAAEPAAKAEPVKPAKPEPKQEPVKPAPVKEQVKQPAKAETKPEPKPDGAVPVVSVVHDDDPIKLTTNSFQAQSRKKAETAKKEPAKPTSKPEAVKPKPEPVKPKPPQVVREIDETNVMPVVKDIPAKQVPPNAAPEATSMFPTVANKPPVVGTRPPAAGTKPAAMATKPAAMATKPAAVADKPAAVEEEDENISIKSVIFMALTGIVIGAVIFLGFKQLWANVNSTLVCILAGVMTLGIVGVVHALRTERDGMSMALAAVTGAVLTFGPLLVVGL